MIVLDEQILGHGIEDAVARWYPGAVLFVLDLRPGTIIKDEAIPTLLARESEPTFVTINVSDFWQRVPVTGRFCVVCCAVPDAEAGPISSLPRRLLSHPDFKTKAQRMGKVVRVTAAGATYYAAADKAVRNVENW